MHRAAAVAAAADAMIVASAAAADALIAVSEMVAKEARRQWQKLPLVTVLNAEGEFELPKKTVVNDNGFQAVQQGVFREDGSLCRGKVTCGGDVREGLFVDDYLVEGKIDFGDGEIHEGLWAVELDDKRPGPLVRGEVIVDGEVVRWA